MIFEYFKKLFSKWLSKFSVITGICGFVAFYTGYDPSNMVAKFIINNLLHVSLLFLIISSYQVWLEVQQELDKIKKNPVDYKVTAKIQKIFINLDKIKKVYKTKEEIKEALEECENEILVLEKLSQVDKSPEMKLRELFDNDKSTNDYLAELNGYKRELESYIEKSQENFSQWSKFSEYLKNIYIVDFYMESIGNKSDKNIDIEIRLNNNSYIESLYKQYEYLVALKTPEKPNKMVAHNNFMSSYNRNFSFQLPTLPPMYIKDAFRKFMEFKEKSLFVNLREMNVGDNISIFKEKVLIELPKKEEIKVIIKSENSNAKIEKAVEFEVIEESIEYFDYLESLLKE